MNIIPLHVTTSYTFLSSPLLLEPFFVELEKRNIKYCGITDFNTLMGFPNFYKLAKEKNIEPLFGMEIIVQNNYLSLYCINEDGYKSLINLSFLYSKEKNINYDDLIKNSTGLLCIISTSNSELFNEVDEVIKSKRLLDLERIFSGNFYIGLEAYDSDNIVLKETRLFLKKHPFNFLAFPNIKYINKNEEIKLRILNSIKNGTTLSFETEIEEDGVFYLRSEEEIEKIYTPEEIFNTHKIPAKLLFNFSTKRGKILKFTNDLTNSSKSNLENLCLEGLKNKNIAKPEYFLRLSNELSVIDSMGYNDYFLIVQDYVNFAKNNNILVGPGRGSAAGSLVAYALNITEVDPLKYNLLFERFLNKDRLSMPDIDIDFEDTKREQVINYLKNKYGTERVAAIATLQEIKARQAIRDIGRVYDLNPIDIDKMSKMLTNPKYSLMESYNKIKTFRDFILSDQYYQRIFKLALKIERLPRQQGLHAAGIVLNDESILSSLPVIYDNNLKMLVSQYEMDNLEEQGFLKMDLLGLTNLSTIHFILDLIKKNKNIELEFSKISIDEKEIYPSLINKGLTMGLFQLESDGMNRAISIVKPECFNDIVSILALFRPGPMENIPIYAQRKNNNTKINYGNPEAKQILSETYGIIVYQEQIMQIAERIAGFSLSKADIFRRAISKKHISELEELKKEFIDGCIKKGYAFSYGNSLFNTIVKFANYGFNKSHSVAYAMITSRMAYLKMMFPQEFYIALLQANAGINDFKFNKFIEEFKKLKISIALPNINKSTNIFVNSNNTMIMPFSSIKGLTTDTIQKILYIRETCGPFNGLIDFVRKTYEYKISESQIIKLIKSGCFDSFNKNRKSMLDKLEVIIKNVSVSSKANLLDLFNENDITFDIYTKENEIEKIFDEYDLLGIMISSNPIELHKKDFKDKVIKTINNLNENEPSNILVLIKTKKLIFTKKDKKEMLFLLVNDEENGSIEVVVFPSVYEKYNSLLETGEIVLINGTLENKNGKKTFIAEHIEKETHHE